MTSRTSPRAWTLEDAKQAAMAILGRRDHSRDELARKLQRKGVPRSLVEDVCERLEELGYVDDVRFAMHQAALLVERQWGPLRIEEKLKKHGVSPLLVDDALDEYDDAFWAELAEKRLDAHFGSVDIQGDQRAKLRAFRHLVGRGFAPDLARRILLDP